MLRAVREALETYASGVGQPVADVIREFKKLPEAEKFEVLARIKDLEKAHQAWLATGKLPAPPPEQSLPAPAPPTQADLAALAREQRGQYALGRMLARQSPILGANGRPIVRD